MSCSDCLHNFKHSNKSSTKTFSCLTDILSNYIFKLKYFIAVFGFCSWKMYFAAVVNCLLPVTSAFCLFLKKWKSMVRGKKCVKAFLFKLKYAVSSKNHCWLVRQESLLCIAHAVCHIVCDLNTPLNLTIIFDVYSKAWGLLRSGLWLLSHQM